MQRLAVELRLDEAEKKLKDIRNQDPDNLYLDLLSGRILFFRSYIPDNKKQYDKYEEQFDEHLKSVQKGSDKEVITHIASSELYLIKAFLEMRYGSSWGTAWNGYMAWSELETVIEQSPDHPLVQYGNGLLQATVGSLPENFQFFTRLIGMKGSVLEGLNLMDSAVKNEVVRNNGVFYEEFAYMYCLVRFQLLDDSSTLLSEYDVDVKGSSFFLYMQTLQLLQRGENDKAVSILTARPTGNGRIAHPFMDLMTGKVLLNRQDPRAGDWFQKYLDGYKGKNHIKAVHRYLFWHFSFLGANEKAARQRQLAVSSATSSSKDLQAKEDLEDDMPLFLIRARLLFDGGYDVQAKTLLNDPSSLMQASSPIERTEYYYRRGRINYRLGLFSEAQLDFKRAVEYCTEERYNCANSWLYLGFIAEKKQNSKKAKECYEEVLKQSGFAYFEGLQQKAKSGLERLEE